MAPRHGKRTGVYYDGYDLSRFFNQAASSAKHEVADSTCFQSPGDAKTFAMGLGEGTFSASGLYDADPLATDTVFATALGADASSVMTIAIEGVVQGRTAKSAAIKTVSYDITSPVADMVSVSMEAQADGGVDNGVLLAVVAAAATTSQTTAVDNAVLTSQGIAAYLHVVANTRNGTTVFKVQHSVDNSTWADLATFTTVAISTLAAERVIIAAGTTVNRYLRVLYTLGGSTGTISFVVNCARRTH